ncbi:MAG: hypothetical protein ABEJ22_01805 [Haloferacaceae archaeon]
MGEESAPADTMRERAGTSRFKLWFLVESRRLVVVAALFVATFLLLVAVGAVVPNAAGKIQSGDPVETAFQAFIGATVTGVTLVLTLNQLVLSQELGAVGDQRERMEAAMQFRSDVEERLESPISPPEPSAFFRALIDRIRDQTGALADSVDSDGDLAEKVDALRDDIEGNAASVTEQLTGAQFGTFSVVSAALNFNYSWKIYAARRIRAEYRDQLTDEQMDELDSLVETLELFGPTREHFKTLYVQWELVNLSRGILFASIPAVVVATTILLYFDAKALTWSVLGVPASVLVVSAGVAGALVPFLVLLAYILRIATITKRTLSIGSFVLRKTSGREDIDWESDGE